jgi:hypothetical protein
MFLIFFFLTKKITIKNLIMKTNSNIMLYFKYNPIEPITIDKEITK